MSNAIQIDAFTIAINEKENFRLENIYCTDVFDTLKNGKLRNLAPIIPKVRQDCRRKHSESNK